ncbi:MAG: chromosome segregation protein SMC [Synergistaceae bacterium]|nr:chromosome segregation protein SMC [Synergistaceae bacterium]
MAITSLKLKGFKSFGRQCDFEFSKNFTAIVGPNGSGKSNILDALKWILGEGSSSGLRITRQSDLLFQGSFSTPPANNAEVILNLQAEDQKGSLRRIYAQESGAVLFLDNKKILLQELERIKARFNLEGEGFALIGQGEISDTIHQRPKERRKQFDALFGIERYRERRDDSVKKLEETQNESQRIKTLIEELNARRAEISGEVEIALQAQGILDELDVLRHDYYFFKRRSIENEQADFEVKRQIITSRLDGVEAWLRRWTKGLKFYEEKLAPDKEHNLFLTRLVDIRTERDTIHRHAFLLARQVKEIKSKRGELQNDRDALKLQRDSLEQERQRTQEEQNNLSQELEAKQKDFSEREKIFNDAQTKSKNELARRKKIFDEIAGLKLKRSRLEADISATEKSHEAALKEISSIEEQCSAKKIEIENLTAQKNSIEENFSRLAFSCQQESSNVQALRRELAHLESQYNNLSGSNFFTTGIYPEPVRIILKAAEKNLISSKPQAVADVFSCSSAEVAEAVEAYLGGRQYWLLVHTLEQAQEGIDFLKQNKAGRATYLALERARPRARDTRINLNARGVTGWSMDLITVESEWADALSHIMGDLLIVQDYATASELVRTGVKFPVATLEGEVFATGGTVSGGSSKQKAGAVSARQRQEEITRQIENLKSSIAVTTGKLEKNMTLEKNLRHEFELISNELEDSKANLNAAQRNFKALAGDLERVKNETESHILNKKKLESQLENFMARANELEQEIKDLPDVQEQSYELVIAPLKNELKLLEDRLKVVKTLNERVAGEFKNLCSRISKDEEEIEAGKILEQDNREKLKILALNHAEAYKAEKNLRQEILKRNDEFSAARKKIQRVREKINRANSNVTKINNELANFDAKISHVDNELNQLIELWDDKYPYNKNEAREIEGGRELTSGLRKLERELKSLGHYNLGALSEDQSLTERVDFLTYQLEDVDSASSELKNLIADTDSQVEKSFTNSMLRVDSRFNELFQRLFGGGEARLILQPGPSIWERGVDIFARPPGKKLQNISQLSGGEQSLTSIALIFSTLEAAGTPLAVLDEVDAALDEYNLIRFADLAKEYSRTIQIIAMTHRRATMERADLIYGVTMIEAGLSATVGINPENYE